MQMEKWGCDQGGIGPDWPLYRQVEDRSGLCTHENPFRLSALFRLSGSESIFFS